MLKPYGQYKNTLEILRALFTSKTRVQILNLFIKNPKAKMYQREIAYKTGEKVSPVQYELNNLVKLGFLKTNSTIIRRFYQLNKNFILTSEIKNIFKKLK